MNQISVLALTLVCVLMTTAGQLALKTGASSPQLTALLAAGETPLFVARAMTSPVVLIGLVLYGGSTVLWLIILARAQVSYAYPMVSIGFVLTALYGYYVLHESIGPGRGIGIALIVLGVILVARS